MSGTDTNNGFDNYDEMNSAYRRAVAALRLEMPPGVTLPVDAPGSSRDGISYEPGVGEVRALFAWLEVVTEAAVAAHWQGNTEEALRWTGVAAQFVETDTFARFNDPDVPVSWYDHVIVPALGGDFTHMIQQLPQWPAAASVANRTVPTVD